MAHALFLILAAALAAASPAQAQDATFATRHLTPEVAMKLTQAVLQDCRQRGYQVAVAVVDRGGTLQTFVRDRLAGPHTVEVAANKAWTAVSFRIDTLGLADATAQPGMAGLRHVPRVIAVGGGVPVETAGSIIGAVGVSGGPGGEADHACARAGIAAIQGDLDF